MQMSAEKKTRDWQCKSGEGVGDVHRIALAANLPAPFSIAGEKRIG
jgi:hypothetical protein